MATRAYVSDAKAWERHYESMGEGHMDNGNRFFRVKTKHANPPENVQPVKLVSDSADIVEQAKAQMREEESAYRDTFKHRGVRKPPSKRHRSVLLKDAPPDIFGN